MSDIPWRSRPDIPARTRAAVLRRAGGRCEDCQCERRLEMHHLTYNKMIAGDIVLMFGNEEPDDLVALCRDCHKAAHTVWGVFYEDPDDARYVGEALYREWELG